VSARWRETQAAAIPIATSTTFQRLPPLPPAFFFARPAELVAPDLIDCLLVKRQEDRSVLWGVVVETEAYSQDDPACHGYRRPRAVSYGIHHCVK
jgi:DNA-3-methyladenine glycosylase